MSIKNKLLGSEPFNEACMVLQRQLENGARCGDCGREQRNAMDHYSWSFPLLLGKWICGECGQKRSKEVSNDPVR